MRLLQVLLNKDANCKHDSNELSKKSSVNLPVRAIDTKANNNINACSN